MFPQKLSLLLSVLSLSGLLTLTGCGSSGPTAKAPVTEQKLSAIAYRQQMSERVSDIEEAVRDNDYETAGALFANVQSLWKQGANEIRASNQDAYDAIATHLNNVSNELADNPPEPPNLLNTLDLLKTDFLLLFFAAIALHSSKDSSK